MSPLAERAISLFGEIAVAAGTFEAKHNRPPRHVYLPPADAAALRDYIKQSDATVGYSTPPTGTTTTRAVCRRMLVSDLIVKVGPVGQLEVFVT